MICLIAGTEKHAERFARAQNLRADEWFYAATMFDLVKRKNFHVICVTEGIEHLTNDQLNRLLTAAWENGRKK